MRKGIILSCVLLLALTLALVQPGLAESENLILNGDFSALDASGMPESWYADMWDVTAGVSALGMDDGPEGPCVRVSNISENDARFAQQISVLPDSVYKFSCRVRAEGCTEGGVGANISTLNTFCMSEPVLDTAGGWREIAIYGKTGATQTTMTVFLRVGGYSALTVGTAWFDDVSVIPVAADAVPAGVTVCDFTPQQLTYGSDSENADAEGEPARHTPTFLLMAFVYLLLVLAAVRKSPRMPALDGRGAGKWLAAILGGALILRLILAALVRGYNTDINCFIAWSERFFATGFSGFYSQDVFCDYPPLAIILLWPAAALRRILGVGMNSMGHVMIIKLLPILCDLALAAIVWRFARKKMGEKAALLLAAFVALNPAVFVDSAAWGQIDSVFAVGLVLCALLCAEERFASSLFAFALAVLVKPQALLFAPLGLVAVLTGVFWSNQRGRAALRALAGLAAALATLYAVAFLFCVGSASGFGDAILRPVTWLWNLYGETMGSYASITINALNLYALLGKNWVDMASLPFWSFFAWCMFALAYLYSFLIVIRSKHPQRLFLAGGVLIVLIFAFGPMIHERYVFPALILLAMAYAFERDRRILVSMVVLSVTLFLNEILVLQGGMTEANYGHLQPSEQWLNAAIALAGTLNALFLAWTAGDIVFRNHVISRGFDVEPPTEERAREERPDHRLRLGRRSVALMLAVTAVYAVVAFLNLGDVRAPQSGWTSTAAGESATFDLGSTQTFRMTYYGGICDTNFSVELSEDGVNWSQPCWAKYGQGDVFCWKWFVPVDAGQNVIKAGSSSAQADGSVAYRSDLEEYPFQTARYVRISAVSAGLVLYEVGFLDGEKNPLPVKVIAQTGGVANFMTDAAALADEQDMVPDAPSYLNSMYFDEIYHARTAFEHLHGLPTYEWTHPPLGKVIMMAGVAIFGMTPFGWRFMGALMGVMMLPVLYLLVRRVTRSGKWALVAMLLFALDSMHFSLTRIATIDSYAVFFILLMYLFMARYRAMDWTRTGLGKTLIPLGLCGVTMGCAWATKWTGIYASAGLAAILLWAFLERGKRAYSAVGDEAPAQRKVFWRNVLITLGFCLVFFIVVPLIIYYFSYWWQLRSEGGLSLQKVIALQKRMFDYHSGLGGDTHFFRSDWYEWPIILKPIWFFSGRDYVAQNVVSSISCMGNPAVWWFGLLAILAVTGYVCYARRANRAAVMALIGFASQYLPWILVPRSTFIYHYFASVPFIILASVLVLKWLEDRRQSAQRPVRMGLVQRGQAQVLAFSIVEGVLLCAALAAAILWGAASWQVAMLLAAFLSLVFGVLLCAITRERLSVTACSLLAGAAILFVMFYPLESGLPVARRYAELLRWFQWYNF